MTLPDPDLRWNDERGHYDFGALDWDEFKRVLAGNGPCNAAADRPAAAAHDDGAWVREAAAAHAAKQRETASGTGMPADGVAASPTGRCTRCSCAASAA